MSYTLFVFGNKRVENVSKDVINGEIIKLTGEEKDNYQIIQDVTHDFPTPQDHERAVERLKRMDELSKKIDWTKYEFQMDSEMQRNYAKWNELSKETNEWEARCGY